MRWEFQRVNFFDAMDIAVAPTAPAEFLGTQPGLGLQPDFDLYLLTRAVPGRASGSTVTGQFLESLGFRLPTKN